MWENLPCFLFFDGTAASKSGPLIHGQVKDFWKYVKLCWKNLQSTFDSKSSFCDKTSKIFREIIFNTLSYRRISPRRPLLSTFTLLLYPNLFPHESGNSVNCNLLVFDVGLPYSFFLSIIMQLLNKLRSEIQQLLRLIRSL